ncbi:MAG: CTP synthase [Alphaproteobacteria bacterium]|nr:CTP synthase [Alphaproteobacteria bacterium]
MSKYIFVTGGVSSSLGKGIIAASLAKLLQARGLKVAIQKFDPYINIDPGTMNPYEHGECFVTEDGAETDLDLGHYERFLNTPTSKANNVTTGMIYQSVIDKERNGFFLGKTVQVIPHITDEIKNRMQILGKSNDFEIIITEIGGTVGDIESLPFVEAMRQLEWELPEGDVIVVHLTLVPYLKSAGELKTKPTQHSVKTLLQTGVHPNIIVCRTEEELTNDVRIKIASFCNVKIEAVIEARDAKSIYEVPLNMLDEKLDIICLQKLGISNYQNPDLDKWKQFLYQIHNPNLIIKIGLIGKYVELQDAYKSILESFVHAGAALGTRVEVVSIHSEKITESNVAQACKDLHGVLIAPGFGERGIDGKIAVAKYVRENHVPFLGICLGMQVAVIEFARNVLGLKQAHSTEMDKITPDPIIDLMEEQKSIVMKGGSMRKGAFITQILNPSLAFDIYQSESISERHRHRYEFNNAYLKRIEEKGMLASGRDSKTNLVEIIEIKNHPFYIGVQYHPELKSTVENPSKLFLGFIKACGIKKNIDKDKSLE